MTLEQDARWHLCRCYTTDNALEGDGPSVTTRKLRDNPSASVRWHTQA
jgi:hypothetical protein